MSSPLYLHLPAGSPLPQLKVAKPFKAVLIVEQDVEPAWQELASRWLVSGGCLYLMAWGRRCGDWDDSVDWASLELSDFAEVPDDRFVMTTWHDEESLAEVFWFAEHAATHPSVELSRTVIVDISPSEREPDLLRTYREAQRVTDQS